MDTKEFIHELMVDYILYNRLGENPTNEEIEKLLHEYQISLREKEESIEQIKILIDRLNKALYGSSLYTDSHKGFREKVHEILKNSKQS